MKKNNRYILTLLFLINIIMMIAPVIPHHHHADGVICMKQDLPVESTDFPQHHQTENDACCDSECLVRFHSPTLSVHTDSSPHYEFITTLFTDILIERLLKPQDKQLNKGYYLYRESLHNTNNSHIFGLRAPPFSFFS